MHDDSKLDLSCTETGGDIDLQKIADLYALLNSPSATLKFKLTLLKQEHEMYTHKIRNIDRDKLKGKGGAALAKYDTLVDLLRAMEQTFQQLSSASSSNSRRT